LNALGTVNPIKYMIDKAHEVGAAVILIDGAQAVHI
jgi:cysteine desulfurase/selenocysteine lyase